MRMRIAFLIILLSTAGMHSQNGPAGASNPAKVDSSLVPLDVSVFDNHGNPVTGLTRSDFEVREDGIPQTIRRFIPVDAPYSILVLLDCRSGMRDRMQLLADAIPRFVNQLRKDDRVEIKLYEDLQTPNMVVHAFYVRHLLPIWFDVQVLERQGGTAPPKSWQFV